MMKPKYMIGFFSVLVIFAALLSAGYRMSYSRVLQKQAALEQSAADTRSVEAETDQTGEEPEGEAGFFLCELQGYVAVYTGDRRTLYEFTEIPVNDLPGELQHEIAAGKYISSEDELYGFLENYSS